MLLSFTIQWYQYKLRSSPTWNKNTCVTPQKIPIWWDCEPNFAGRKQNSTLNPTVDQAVQVDSFKAMRCPRSRFCHSTPQHCASPAQTKKLCELNCPRIVKADYVQSDCHQPPLSNSNLQIKNKHFMHHIELWLNCAAELLCSSTGSCHLVMPKKLWPTQNPLKTSLIQPRAPATCSD